MSKRTPVVTIEYPSIDRAAKFVKSALSERKTIILVGNCWVEYKGRANSKLEPGERFVIIKEDGSVLVHRPSGYEPVNWQPAGCKFQTIKRDNNLRIRATRLKPHESVNITFDLIFLVSTMSLVDSGNFFLHASESDMQKAILI
jgi:RecB family endonuclease NucS